MNVHWVIVSLIDCKVVVYNIIREVEVSKDVHVFVTENSIFNADNEDTAED